MKSIVTVILSLICFIANAQLSSIVVIGDTVFNVNPSTGVRTQITTEIKTLNGASLIGRGNISFNRYALQVQALTSSPADGQTVYFGMLPKAPVTAAATSKIYIRRTGTITGAEIYCYSGTAGSAESWTIYIRKNNTTDYAIATVAASASERVFSNQSLSIPVVAGDYIEIKSVNPTWQTNPLTTIWGGYIIIE